jgi:hypothetical protein
MNVTNLIDAIVRQTSVLLAQLATNGGGRAQLANTANQVFLDLVEALREQGLGSRVIADMFGLALRTYQERVRRLSESRTIRGKSLWEAVLEHIQTQGPVLRADVLSRFRYDDGESVRGVLRDLVNASLVYRTGRADGVSYRALEHEHLSRLATESEESLFNVVHISVQQMGPLTRAELGIVTALSEEVLDRALNALTARGLVRVEQGTEESRYTSFGCVLPFDDPKGWEAAVFDHYQALVGALVAKLSLGARGANLRDVIGGSTYGFEVWPGHPHYEEVRGLLQEDATPAGECTTCLMPNDPNWACTEDADCCGGMVCSPILEQPNRCVTPPDPCTARACDTCSGVADCWVAGCEWLPTSSLCQAFQPVIEPPDAPCSVDATDPSLPGVVVHLESDSCSYLQGTGGEFRYTVTSSEALDFTSASSGGGCGLCGVPEVLDTWTSFLITGTDAKYCPECNVGCCAPTEAVPAELAVQSFTQVVTWPGLQWSGPSDTGNEPSGAFAVGDYIASVKVEIPGRGQVVAELPIHVIATKD